MKKMIKKDAKKVAKKAMPGAMFMKFKSKMAKKK